MKKGKNSSKKRAVEESAALHFHRRRVIHASLAFDFTTPSPNCSFGVSSDSTDNDGRNYVIRFNPPLERIYASSSYLTITHIESKRMDTRLCILPKTTDMRLDGRWFVFVTHLVELDESINQCVALHLSIQNCQLQGNIDTPIWQPTFRLEWFLKRELGGDRFIPLSPIPQNGPTIDVSKQHQGSAVLNKGANGITSSRTGKLIGYFLAGVDGGQKEVFGGWKAATVRFGKINEPIAMLMYLKKHEDRVFQEAGYMSIGETIHGAMVDGIISETAKPDSEILLSAPGLPIDQMHQLDAAAPLPLGAIEFKCSRSNCNFEPFHISQCIWEMACGFPHVDLVRYAEIPTKQEGTNNWSIRYECKEIRIYRESELEQELLRLCKLSAPLLKSNYTEFVNLIQTPPYQKMRSYLEKMASDCNERAVPIPVDTDLLNRLAAYKESILSVQFDDSLLIHPILDRIEKRQATIFAAFQEEDQLEFIRSTLEQMQDYAELIKIRPQIIQ